MPVERRTSARRRRRADVAGQLEATPALPTATSPRTGPVSSIPRGRNHATGPAVPRCWAVSADRRDRRRRGALVDHPRSSAGRAVASGPSGTTSPPPAPRQQLPRHDRPGLPRLNRRRPGMRPPAQIGGDGRPSSLLLRACQPRRRAALYPRVPAAAVGGIRPMSRGIRGLLRPMGAPPRRGYARPTALRRDPYISMSVTDLVDPARRRHGHGRTAITAVLAHPGFVERFCDGMDNDRPLQPSASHASTRPSTWRGAAYYRHAR